MIHANILDPIHSELDPRVWDNAGAPKPRLKRAHHSWIIRHIEKTLTNAGYDQLDQWLDLVLTGSLTTYQYSDESDVDVSLFVNVERFPDWSRSEMIALMVSKVDGTKLPGTPHPMQCFVVPQGVGKQDLYKPGLRSGYDLYDDAWVVPPDPDRVEDVEQQQNADYVYALESADKMERLLRYDPQQAVNYWHQIHKRRQRDQKAGKGDYAQSNIVYKFLAQRGLFPSISSASGEYIAKVGSGPWLYGDDPRAYQTGLCGTYARVLKEIRPELRFGVAGEANELGGYWPRHWFAHDNEYAYDSLGKHRLPYVGNWDTCKLDIDPTSRLAYENPDEQQLQRARAHANTLHGPRQASFSVDDEALEQARDHLELAHPVSVNIVGGHAGRYHGLQDGAHQADVVGWLRPESASKQAWHELAHARQYEQDPERWSHTLQEYWRDPKGHRWEREARELAEAHPFPLVKRAMPEKCPHCGAIDEYQGGLCYSCGHGSAECPRCGFEVGDNEGWCPACHYQVGHDSRPVATPPWTMEPEQATRMVRALPPSYGADKARVLFQKFRPNQTHPPGRSGPDMPFIYDPHQDTVFLGPPQSYHWELLRHVPELAGQYPKDQDWTKAPFLVNPEHVHGRMTWPGKETDFLGERVPYETRARVNEALGAPPPPEDDAPIWDFSGTGS
jgi:hypothetical protein